MNITLLYWQHKFEPLCNVRHFSNDIVLSLICISHLTADSESTHFCRFQKVNSRYGWKFINAVEIKYGHFPQVNIPSVAISKSLDISSNSWIHLITIEIIILFFINCMWFWYSNHRCIMDTKPDGCYTEIIIKQQTRLGIYSMDKI